jgi:two-component SAPR family response regulator
LKINNSNVGRIDFVVLNELIREVTSLSETVSEEVQIYEDDILINSNLTNNVVMKYNYAISLYYRLLNNVGRTGAYAAVNDDIDTLRRVLTIVKRKINE